MTLEGWLAGALDNLALDVRKRLEAEYREHVRGALDAGESEGEVLTALGDPRRINRELLATHLSVYEAKVLQNRIATWTSRSPWAPLGMGLIMSLMLLGLKQSWFSWAALPLLVGLLGSAALSWMQRHWTGEKAAALYAAPTLQLTTMLVWVSAQTVFSRPSWSKALAFLLGSVLLFLWVEVARHGSLYRKAKAGKWTP